MQTGAGKLAAKMKNEMHDVARSRWHDLPLHRIIRLGNHEEGESNQGEHMAAEAIGASPIQRGGGQSPAVQGRGGLSRKRPKHRAATPSPPPPQPAHRAAASRDGRAHDNMPQHRGGGTAANIPDAIGTKRKHGRDMTSWRGSCSSSAASSADEQGQFAVEVIWMPTCCCSFFLPAPA